MTVPEIWRQQNRDGKTEKKKINNEANWMVSYSAKLDSRPRSTLNLESLRVTVPEIWPGQKWRKKEKKRKKNEH